MGVFREDKVPETTIRACMVAIHAVCTDTFGTPSRYVIMVITWPIGSSALATHELATRILDHTGESALYIYGILLDQIEMRICEKVFRACSATIFWFVRTLHSLLFLDKLRMEHWKFNPSIGIVFQTLFFGKFETKQKFTGYQKD